MLFAVPVDLYMISLAYYRLLGRYIGKIRKQNKNKQIQATPNKNTQATNKEKTPRETSKNVSKTPEY